MLPTGLAKNWGLRVHAAGTSAINFKHMQQTLVGGPPGKPGQASVMLAFEAHDAQHVIVLFPARQVKLPYLSQFRAM